MTLLSYPLALDPHALYLMHQRCIDTARAIEPGLARAWIAGLAT